MNDETKFLIREFYRQRLTDVKNFGDRMMENYRVSANNAQNELHRYTIAGAAGGIAILVAQIEGANQSELIIVALSLVSFVCSLYFSFNAVQSKWVLESEQQAKWASWTLDNYRRIDSHESEFGDPRTIPELTETPNESIDTTSYRRWASLATGALTGGGIAAIGFLMMQIQWCEVSWVSRICSQ